MGKEVETLRASGETLRALVETLTSSVNDCHTWVSEQISSNSSKQASEVGRLRTQLENALIPQVNEMKDLLSSTAKAGQALFAKLAGAETRLTDDVVSLQRLLGEECRSLRRFATE